MSGQAILQQLETTVPLGANAQFVSPMVDLGRDQGGYDRLRVVIDTDQAGSLLFLESSDKATYHATAGPTPVAAGVASGVAGVNVAQMFEMAVTLRYVKVAYINGATPQTVMYLYVAALAI